MTSGKNARLTELFARWQPQYGDHFVKDGILCEDSWENARHRVLFVMRETNDYVGDLRDTLEGGGWTQVARWAYGMLQTDADVACPFEEANRADNREKGLRIAALMNLKKTPGGASSDPCEICFHAWKDRKWIKEEFDIVDPHIVVCCGNGTANGLRHAVPFRQPLADMKGCWFDNGRLFIETLHWRARKKKLVMHESLVNPLKTALGHLRDLGEKCPAWASPPQ